MGYSQKKLFFRSKGYCSIPIYLIQRAGNSCCLKTSVRLTPDIRRTLILVVKQSHFEEFQCSWRKGKTTLSIMDTYIYMYIYQYLTSIYLSVCQYFCLYIHFYLSHLVYRSFIFKYRKTESSETIAEAIFHSQPYYLMFSP